MIHDYFRVAGAHNTVQGCADFSLLLFMTIALGNRYKMGCSFTIHVKDSIRCAIQNCIGIVRHGDSSEDIDAHLSRIEDNGELEYRSETPITKL